MCVSNWDVKEMRNRHFTADFSNNKHSPMELKKKQSDREFQMAFFPNNIRSSLTIKTGP